MSLEFSKRFIRLVIHLVRTDRALNDIVYVREPTEGGFTKGGVCEKRPREGLVVVRKWPGFPGSKFWKIGPDLW